MSFFSQNSIHPGQAALQKIDISRIDRWQVYHRLQELSIPCWCLDDGSLRVEVQTTNAAVIVRSVVQQFTASRRDLVSWLEQCWQECSQDYSQG
ncbi:MAG: Asr1405/Asl0597 family protein [Microcoleaceae cyanobacterium]